MPESGTETPIIPVQNIPTIIESNRSEVLHDSLTITLERIDPSLLRQRVLYNMGTHVSIEQDMAAGARHVIDALPDPLRQQVIFSTGKEESMMPNDCILVNPREIPTLITELKNTYQPIKSHNTEYTEEEYAANQITSNLEFMQQQCDIGNRSPELNSKVKNIRQQIWDKANAEAQQPSLTTEQITQRKKFMS